MLLNLLAQADAILADGQSSFLPEVMDNESLEAQREALIAFGRQSTTKWIVAFSGGKDSIAMVLHLLDIGIPKSQIELWHHDVDGGGSNLWDWKCTTDYCKAFAKAFDLPILFSWRVGGITREIYRTEEHIQNVQYENIDGELITLQSDTKRGVSTRGKFPAVESDLKKRWCSATVKIMVMSRVITNDARFKNADVIICTGERRQESKSRSRYNEIEVYQATTKKRTAYTYRPIIDWSEDEVWAIMERYKVQPHPAYELGWGRCSCQTCIFNGDNVWATIAEISPEKIEAIEAIETDISFTLYDKINIRQKASRGQSFLSLLDENKREYWVQQATVHYNAPIIVNEWHLPLGAKSKEKSGAV